MNIFRIRKTYKSARRFQQIINVFLRHGFGNVIDQMHLGRFIPFRKRIKAFGQWPGVKGPTVPERLRIAFEELGPSFIKFAQLLSSRPDLITQPFADEFKKLQDEVPPFSSDQARSIVERELKRPIEDVFVDFGHVPMAAASIAQVHTATLKSGRGVIVKVQRPAIKETIENDIEILGVLARLMENHIPESRFFNPSGIVHEFARTVRRELDFAEEARNAVRLKRNLESNPKVYIPYVHSEHLTDKVLVMERVEGISLDEAERIGLMGIDRAGLATTLVDAYLKMLLEDGFFHADPHPGNLLAMPGGIICFMDFGIVGRVSEETKDALIGTFSSLLKRDYNALIEHYIELGYLPEDSDHETFKREFKADLRDFLEPLMEKSISEINLVEVMDSFITMATRHGLIMPSDLLLINKTLFLLDNAVRSLDPDFNLFVRMEPYAERILAKRFSPASAIGKTARGLFETGEALTVLPRQMQKLLKRILRDDLKVKISLTGLEHFIRDMDRSSNRIAFALVISAMIMSSALMHSLNTGPKVYGLSLLGIITFAGAFFMGVWLLISIIRSGRL